jgi:HEPN domain-containing protein
MQKATARKWLRQALHDLQMAEKNIAIEGYDVAAFLAHQAVEKLLKALFALQGRKIPRTHFIDELALALNLTEETMEHIFDLTADYTLSRYPDVSDAVPYEQYNEAIALEKVGSAKKVFELLRILYHDLQEEENYD